jgi:phosphotransferase system enzyme I (PtsI)
MATEPNPKEETIVQGISASQGIAYGQIFVYLQSEVEIPTYQVDPEKRIDEIARFDKALLVTRQQIAKIQDEVEKNLGKNEALIFDAHLLVLEDQALISETIREFEDTGRNIETCFDTGRKKYIQAFAEIDDEYLRERAGDIKDVAQRVLQNLLGQAENSLSRLVERASWSPTTCRRPTPRASTGAPGWPSSRTRAARRATRSSSRARCRCRPWSASAT